MQAHFKIQGCSIAYLKSMQVISEIHLWFILSNYTVDSSTFKWSPVVKWKNKSSSLCYFSTNIQTLHHTSKFNFRTSLKLI